MISNSIEPGGLVKGEDDSKQRELYNLPYSQRVHDPLIDGKTTGKMRYNEFGVNVPESLVSHTERVTLHTPQESNFEYLPPLSVNNEEFGDLYKHFYDGIREPTTGRTGACNEAMDINIYSGLLSRPQLSCNIAVFESTTPATNDNTQRLMSYINGDKAYEKMNYDLIVGWNHLLTRDHYAQGLDRTLNEFNEYSVDLEFNLKTHLERFIEKFVSLDTGDVSDYLWKTFHHPGGYRNMIASSDDCQFLHTTEDMKRSNPVHTCNLQEAEELIKTAIDPTTVTPGTKTNKNLLIDSTIRIAAGHEFQLAFNLAQGHAKKHMFVGRAIIAYKKQRIALKREERSNDRILSTNLPLRQVLENMTRMIGNPLSEEILQRCCVVKNKDGEVEPFIRVNYSEIFTVLDNLLVMGDLQLMDWYNFYDEQMDYFSYPCKLEVGGAVAYVTPEQVFYYPSKDPNCKLQIHSYTAFISKMVGILQTQSIVQGIHVQALTHDIMNHEEKTINYLCTAMPSSEKFRERAKRYVSSVKAVRLSITLMESGMQAPKLGASMTGGLFKQYITVIATITDIASKKTSKGEGFMQLHSCYMFMPKVRKRTEDLLKEFSRVYGEAFTSQLDQIKKEMNDFLQNFIELFVTYNMLMYRFAGDDTTKFEDMVKQAVDIVMGHEEVPSDWFCDVDPGVRQEMEIFNQLSEANVLGDHMGILEINKYIKFFRGEEELLRTNKLYSDLVLSKFHTSLKKDKLNIVFEPVSRIKTVSIPVYYGTKDQDKDIAKSMYKLPNPFKEVIDTFQGFQKLKLCVLPGINNHVEDRSKRNISSLLMMDATEMNEFAVQYSLIHAGSRETLHHFREVLGLNPLGKNFYKQLLTKLKSKIEVVPAPLRILCNKLMESAKYHDRIPDRLWNCSTHAQKTGHILNIHAKFLEQFRNKHTHGKVKYLDGLYIAGLAKKDTFDWINWYKEQPKDRYQTSPFEFLICAKEFSNRIQLSESLLGKNGKSNVEVLTPDSMTTFKFDKTILYQDIDSGAARMFNGIHFTKYTKTEYDVANADMIKSKKTCTGGYTPGMKFEATNSFLLNTFIPKLFGTYTDQEIIDIADGSFDKLNSFLELELAKYNSDANRIYRTDKEAMEKEFPEIPDNCSFANMYKYVMSKFPSLMTGEPVPLEFKDFGLAFVKIVDETGIGAHSTSIKEFEIKFRLFLCQFILLRVFQSRVEMMDFGLFKFFKPIMVGSTDEEKKQMNDYATLLNKVMHLSLDLSKFCTSFNMWMQMALAETAFELHGIPGMELSSWVMNVFPYSLVASKDIISSMYTDVTAAGAKFFSCQGRQGQGLAQNKWSWGTLVVVDMASISFPDLDLTTRIIGDNVTIAVRSKLKANPVRVNDFLLMLQIKLKYFGLDLSSKESIMADDSLNDCQRITMKAHTIRKTTVNAAVKTVQFDGNRLVSEARSNYNDAMLQALSNESNKLFFYLDSWIQHTSLAYFDPRSKYHPPMTVEQMVGLGLMGGRFGMMTGINEYNTKIVGGINPSSNLIDFIHTKYGEYDLMRTSESALAFLSASAATVRGAVLKDPLMIPLSVFSRHPSALEQEYKAKALSSNLETVITEILAPKHFASLGAQKHSAMITHILSINKDDDPHIFQTCMGAGMEDTDGDKPLSKALSSFSIHASKLSAEHASSKLESQYCANKGGDLNQSINKDAGGLYLQKNKQRMEQQEQEPYYEDEYHWDNDDDDYQDDVFEFDTHERVKNDMKFDYLVFVKNIFNAEAQNLHEYLTVPRITFLNMCKIITDNHKSDVVKLYNRGVLQYPFIRCGHDIYALKNAILSYTIDTDTNTATPMHGMVFTKEITMEQDFTSGTDYIVMKIEYAPPLRENHSGGYTVRRGMNPPCKNSHTRKIDNCKWGATMSTLALEETQLLIKLLANLAQSDHGANSKTIDAMFELLITQGDAITHGAKSIMREIYAEAKKQTNSTSAHRTPLALNDPSSARMDCFAETWITMMMIGKYTENTNLVPTDFLNNTRCLYPNTILTMMDLWNTNTVYAIIPTKSGFGGIRQSIDFPEYDERVIKYIHMNIPRYQKELVKLPKGLLPRIVRKDAQRQEDPLIYLEKLLSKFPGQYSAKVFQAFMVAEYIAELDSRDFPGEDNGIARIRPSKLHFDIFGIIDGPLICALAGCLAFMNEIPFGAAYLSYRIEKKKDRTNELVFRKNHRFHAYDKIDFSKETEAAGRVSAILHTMVIKNSILVGNSTLTKLPSFPTALWTIDTNYNTFMEFLFILFDRLCEISREDVMLKYYLEIIATKRSSLNKFLRIIYNDFNPSGEQQVPPEMLHKSQRLFELRKLDIECTESCRLIDTTCGRLPEYRIKNGFGRPRDIQENCTYPVIAEVDELDDRTKQFEKLVRQVCTTGLSGTQKRQIMMLQQYSQFCSKYQYVLIITVGDASLNLTNYLSHMHPNAICIDISKDKPDVEAHTKLNKIGNLCHQKCRSTVANNEGIGEYISRDIHDHARSIKCVRTFVDSKGLGMPNAVLMIAEANNASGGGYVFNMEIYDSMIKVGDKLATHFKIGKTRPTVKICTRMSIPHKGKLGGDLPDYIYGGEVKRTFFGNKKTQNYFYSCMLNPTSPKLKTNSQRLVDKLTSLRKGKICAVDQLDFLDYLFRLALHPDYFISSQVFLRYINFFPNIQKSYPELKHDMLNSCDFTQEASKFLKVSVQQAVRDTDGTKFFLHTYANSRQKGLAGDLVGFFKNTVDAFKLPEEAITMGIIKRAMSHSGALHSSKECGMNIALFIARLINPTYVFNNDTFTHN